MLPLSTREEAAWIAFERVHGPLQPNRDDAYAAQVTYLLGALLYSWTAGKNDTPPKREDFVIEWDVAGKADDPTLGDRAEYALTAVGARHTGAEPAPRLILPGDEEWG